MSLSTKVVKSFSLLQLIVKEPYRFIRFLGQIPFVMRGNRFALKQSYWLEADINRKNGNIEFINPVEKLFYHASKPLTKWDHYFRIYHHHLSKFVGKKPIIMEIGVLGGGSLQMWRNYFGEGCKVVGVDINPDCKQHEEDGIEIFIGNQEDKSFWDKLNEKVPKVDVIIDDGGHEYEQQIVTIEKMLEKLTLGGVYICEDIIGENNYFAPYLFGMANNLNSLGVEPSSPGSKLIPFQKQIKSIHFYPFVVVVEKNDAPVNQINQLFSKGESKELF